MAPREMIVTMTKNRMDKLNQFGGGPIPIRVKGAGKSGEFTAVMMPKNSGGMLCAGCKVGCFRRLVRSVVGLIGSTLRRKHLPLRRHLRCWQGRRWLLCRLVSLRSRAAVKRRRWALARSRARKSRRALIWRRRLVQLSPSRKGTIKKRTPCNVSARSLRTKVAVKRRKKLKIRWAISPKLPRSLAKRVVT